MVTVKLNQIKKAEDLVNEGKYNDALSILKNFVEKESPKASDQLASHLLQSSILNKLGQYQESYKIGEQAY